ncbi:MAG TPA: hypothetical protein DHW42_07625 [Candidatus Marinimicrobia bacterium]|nr:hypothetical protein [Candidatus Neomarinimicrobiota bacterium]
MNTDTIARSDQYRIHSYEIDLSKQLRFSSLIRYMQESAWKNAEQLGFGFSALISKNLAWVLTRMIVTIDRMPGWNESLKINTWHSGKDQIFAYRDFNFFDQKERELGRATSSWCVIDINSRRPVPVDQAFDILLPDHPNHMFADRPGKIADLKNNHSKWATLVGYQDLDVNEHATSSRYIDWLFETFDLDFLKTRTVSQLEINFLAEARFGKEIIVQTEKLTDSEYLHRISQKETDIEICRAKTVWK